MSRRQKKILCTAILLFVITVGITLVSVRAGTSDSKTANLPSPGPTPPASSMPQSETKRQSSSRSRLSSQPAAFKLAMRLGKRFRSSGRAESLLVGTLRRGADEQQVRIVRRQADTGESIEVALGSGNPRLVWSEAEGFMASDSTVSEADRLLLERLVLDTPDGFILSQLRGSSYQTIARGVRPSEAGDDYSGPVWDIVQVKEPATNASSGAQSSWRLYWLNASTGVIDKVISREGGAEVIATLSGWAKQRGELMPTRIIWMRQGDTLMQLDFTGFNYSEQQSQQ